MTDTVVEVTPIKMFVQTAPRMMGLELGPETKGSGVNSKAGDNVTLTYTMTATEMDANGGEINFGQPGP